MQFAIHLWQGISDINDSFWVCLAWRQGESRNPLWSESESAMQSEEEKDLNFE